MGMILKSLPKNYRPGTKGTVWAIEEANLLAINLWLDGKTASDVAGEVTCKFRMRVSRSAVISRMHRLGFARGSRYHRLDVRIGLARKPKRQPPERSYVVLAPPQDAKPEPLPPEPPAPEKSIPFELLDTLKDETGKLFKNCRWIYGSPRDGGHRFCSCPAVPGTSYCAAHGREMIQKPKPPEPRAERKRFPVRLMLEAAE